jgi:glyoxylase I family protein
MAGFKPTGINQIRGLHHHAYRTRDSEQTRRFYEELLGLPLIASFIEDGARTGSDRRYLHTFFEMGDGSCLAFFEVEGDTTAEPPPAPMGHHVALEVQGEAIFEEYLARVREHGLEPRVIHHGYCKSLYVNDPNGLRVELTTRVAETTGIMAQERARAHEQLAQWRAGAGKS